MKFASAFCIALIGTLVVSCSNSDSPKPNPDKRRLFTDVADYNDYLVDQLDMLTIAYDNSLDANITTEEALKRCDSLVTLCEKAAENIKGIQPFEGDSSLAMQMLDYVRFLKFSGEKSIPEFLKMDEEYINLPDSETQEIERLGKKIDEVAVKQNTARNREHAKVDKAQAKFGKKHQLTIVKLD
ncbi:hypothetical protein [Fluviicola sp.]|uniref:hypothetical protein n=1 Tax=Fluviicola sp. TaxID=1917219 RepID=UPI002625F954|nr:hypothetical protein [Fluviicola sp.]